MRITEWIGARIAKRNATPLCDVGNVHARKAATIAERIFPDTRHAVTDRHSRQTAAIVECIFPDARHAVGVGKASGRERVEVSVVAGSLKNVWNH